MQIKSKISYFNQSRMMLWLKIFIFFAVLYSVYLLIRQKGVNIEAVWQSFNLIFSAKNLLLFIIIFCLTPINWAFEAWRWQKLASKVEDINFWEAYQGVLAGLAMSVATPMMLGDYAGKILMLKTDKRLQSIGAILLGNGLQMYVSLFFGTISYIFFIVWSKPSPIYLHIFIVLGLIIFLLFGIILSFNLNKIPLFLAQKNLFKYLKKYLTILKYYNLSELRSILLIAAGRYCIFTMQFIIILKIFEINLPIFILLAGIGIIFLAKTIASVLNFFGDLSIRELTSVYYFSYFGVQTSNIASATLIIWLINILLPILVGSLFILQLKFITKKL